MMFSLKDKVSIVTGGAHGIGRAIGELFAEAGACVLLADIDEVAGRATVSEICAKGGEALFCRADVSLPEDVVRAVNLALEKSGRIDILCNNAACLGQFHDILQAGQEEWDLCIKVSLLGTYYFTREVLPWMIRQQQGSIINIASAQALVGCPASVAYTTVKAGLLGFTRSAAYDYGASNVRVNAICPGSIQTRISPKPGSAHYQWQVDNTLLRRVGSPKDVAYASLFLASDEASFVTGTVLAVDGGKTAM